MITVGQIIKPQGIRGELKVKPLTSDPSRFSALRSVCVGGKPYRLTGSRVAAGYVYITLDGVCDRDCAEKLRDAYIEIDRAAAVELDKDEFFVADLVGTTLRALRDGNAFDVGVIKRVDSFGAADVFTVETSEGKSMSFAFIKALAPELDSENGTLTVDGAKLDEVAVYED